MEGDDHDQDDQDHCRYCFECVGPGGLADLLIQPCGCAGTVAHAHVSCLYRWQLAKGDQLRDFDHCEVCHQPYRIPIGALQALITQGHLPQQPARMRLWRSAGLFVRAVGRAINRLLLWVGDLANVVLPLVGAASYALEAHSMAPAVLENPALLKQYKWEGATAVASLFLVFPLLYMGRERDPHARQRRLCRAAALEIFLFRSALVAGLGLMEYWITMSLVGDPSVDPGTRRAAKYMQPVYAQLFALAFPIAAAGVGASSAWWRFWLSYWRHPAREYAALLGACSRLAGFALSVLGQSGLLLRLWGAVAAANASPAWQPLNWAGVGGGRGGVGKQAWRGSGLMEEVEGLGDVFVAGAFSA